MTMTARYRASLSRLLQLASPALPVGGYSYSQGLEWAVAEGTVHDEQSAGRWVADLLEFVVGSFEAPLLARLMTAWRARDDRAVAELNAWFVASRETAELRAETLQMGHSLVRLVRELDAFDEAELARLESIPEPAYPTAWGWMAAAWELPTLEAVAAYLWTWAENQVMVAIKTVPLGQSAGQRLLLALGTRIEEVARRSIRLDDHAFSNFAPAFALASCRHETQYSRLFRS